LISEDGDFLLVTSVKLVLPEVASRAALKIEEYCHSLENRISSYDIWLKVFGDYVEKTEDLFTKITMNLNKDRPT
jgi:hypothetical protein